MADVDPGAVLDEVARVGPAEVLLPEGDDGDALAKQVHAQVGVAPTRVAAWTFAPESASKALKEHFRVGSLAGFGLDREPPSLGAAGAALDYLRATQMTALSHVTRVERHDPGTVVLLDRTSRRRLDLVEREGGEREGTLLGVLDATKTAMGGRCLREWILAPLRDPSAIRRRQEGVEELVKDAFLRRDVAGALAGVRDVERILARVATKRANGRDLLSLGQSLTSLPAAAPPALDGVLDDALRPARAPRPARGRPRAPGSRDRRRPAADAQGGRHLPRRAGTPSSTSCARSRARARTGSRRTRPRRPSGRASRRSRSAFNRVFGYYIEVTKQHLAKVPPEYARRQTRRERASASSRRR